MMGRCFPFKPVELSYGFFELEPIISGVQLETHYREHYVNYINKLNAELKKHPEICHFSLTRLLLDSGNVPADIRRSVLLNAGGVFNHEIYFSGVSASTEKISHRLFHKIERTFGSLEKCGQLIFDCSAAVVGSGYGALVSDRRGRLKITSFENQSTDYLKNYCPILLVDVWEHAYYIQFGADRLSYLRSWLKLINWDFAERMYERAICLK